VVPLPAAAIASQQRVHRRPVEGGKLSWKHLNEIAEELKVDHDIA
jgi:hypothetical protein